MLTVKEAIEKRRSIRSFKPDPVPDALLHQIMEAARLAPSGSNRQPWRFQIIKEGSLKQQFMKEATFGQAVLANAPVIIICGSEMLTFVKRHKLAPPNSEYYGAETEDPEELKKFIPDANMYDAIAITHMTLMATALGLGTCWVQSIKPGAAAKVLGWPRHMTVFTALALGYPAEDPPARDRSSMETILIKEGQKPV
ncbi:MAG: nitroreductase family protein [Dehalococcoidales bacterium]|nr:nitroreductase family protein [Dehalococcoidales bacterium]